MNDNGGIIKFLEHNYTMKYYVGIKIILQKKTYLRPRSKEWRMERENQ